MCLGRDMLSVCVCNGACEGVEGESGVLEAESGVCLWSDRWVCVCMC